MLIEILNSNETKTEVQNNMFVVLETEKYFFCKTKEYPFDYVVLEGIKDPNTGEDRKVFFKILNPELYFINCLGLFTVSNPNGDKIAELNIRTKKLTTKEAKDIFEYVFDKNNELFNSFLAQRRLYSVTSNKNQREEGSLLKYIGVVKELLGCLDQNFFQFKLKPAYRLKNIIQTSQYKDSFVTSKSIEWIVSNLDEFESGKNLKFHPDAIKTGNTYILPNKIISEHNVKGTNIYENRILKGIISKLGNDILKISDEISEYLKEESSFLDQEYASFESIKRVVFKSELQELNKLKFVYKKVKSAYNEIFANVEPIEKFPKMTHIFRTERHYRDIYCKAMAFYKSSLDYPGTFLILGIRNLDILYEFFNYYVIIDILKHKYGQPNITMNRVNRDQLEYVSFYASNCVYRLYYQLQIKREEILPHPEWMKLFSNSNKSVYYSPDIVLEREENGNFNYAIFDAKFSSRSWVTGETFYKLVGKYFFSISFRKEPYKKIDYLYLVYPNQGTADIFTKTEGYYPIMGAVPSSPNNIAPLINTTLKILENWESKMTDFLQVS